MLDDTAPAARINGELMGRFVGKRVTLLCKTGGIQNGVMSVLAPDNVQVTVMLGSVANTFEAEYVEFVGVVESPNVMRAMEVANIPLEPGVPLDLAAYNEGVKMLHSSAYQTLVL